MPAGSAALGRLPNLSPGTFNRAEKELLRSDPLARSRDAGALRGLESLARLNRKLLPFDDRRWIDCARLPTSRDRTYTPIDAATPWPR